MKLLVFLLPKSRKVDIKITQKREIKKLKKVSKKCWQLTTKCAIINKHFAWEEVNKKEMKKV